MGRVRSTAVRERMRRGYRRPGVRIHRIEGVNYTRFPPWTTQETAAAFTPPPAEDKG